MSGDLIRKFLASTPLAGLSSEYVEAIYEDYLKNPDSVDESWRNFFRSFEAANRPEVAHEPIRSSFVQMAKERTRRARRGEAMNPEAAEKQAAVLRLINYYRVRGHQAANLDPLGLTEKPQIPDLEPAFHGLGEQDMDTVFNTGSLATEDRLKLREIIDLVQTVYTGSIGAEYMYITETSEKRWIQRRLEGQAYEGKLTSDEKKQVLMQLTAAEGIERYLHTKYVGQKRFSLEGGDSLIPAMDELLRRSTTHEVEEVVIGMAHRGRLNMLVNVLGKSPADLFAEFEGKHIDDDPRASGDVKYHMGFSTDVEVDGRRCHLVLAFNPSHLEIVNPVVVGSVRARQDRRGDTNGRAVLPVLVHGDAAFAGQGVVMETFQLSQAKGYSTGGTIHIVVNNQIGFTTPNPIESDQQGGDSRSSLYCTDIAKMLEAPVFHVNADDPEAVVFITRLAADYRAEFGKDVIIDLVCYRRHGHNEADEPAVTQPQMYQKIRKYPTTRALYAQSLVDAKIVATDEPSQMMDDYRAGLDRGENIARKTLGMIGNDHTVDWSNYQGKDHTEEVDTSLSLEQIRELNEKLQTLPEGFGLHDRVQRIMKDRSKMAAGGAAMDWGFAETMAYAGLVDKGYQVRLAGQDCGRGTFFHRHVRLHNQQETQSYTPLSHLDNGKFEVLDSLLSEEGVLGFEYGYSTADPDTMVIWEAQFGDFANGAQVLFDQFIASGYAKWGRLCGLAMFLPHGYEGQGPEHSSARLERYLQLCAEHNMQVCVPSTPAQMFHMIRRQMIRRLRSPLVVMTPKSLLRHPLSVSRLEELTDGRFQRIIDEVDELDANKVKRIVFCSGKVYFDIYKARQEAELDDVAIVRIEQLYPFPNEAYAATIAAYPNATDIVWCQEEPENQGAWYQIKHRLQAGLGEQHQMRYATRAGAASTATGYLKVHVKQQEMLMHAALKEGSPL